VHASVAASSAGVDIDPTIDAVALAFVAQGSLPAAGDWKTGSWLNDTTTVPTTHFARALVGPSPGVVTLAPGIFDVYVRVTDSPEQPIKKAGSLRVI
jgi:hypothetical protein